MTETITTFDEAYEAYTRRDVTDWKTLTQGVPRNDLPAVLELVGHELYVDELAQALTEAWVMAEWPEQYLARDTWLEFFTWTEYRVNGEPAERPEKITLFRGRIDPDRMAWTSNRAVAEWFRDRPQHQGKARLWTAEVPGDHLLAHFNNARLDESGQSEDEYVIDPTGITFVEVTETGNTQ